MGGRTRGPSYFFVKNLRGENSYNFTDIISFYLAEKT